MITEEMNMFRIFKRKIVTKIYVPIKEERWRI
jgi:hypothetical protein